MGGDVPKAKSWNERLDARIARIRSKESFT